MKFLNAYMQLAYSGGRGVGGQIILCRYIYSYLKAFDQHIRNTQSGAWGGK